MTDRGEEYAKRTALNNLDIWLGETGAISECSSWYYELQSIIEDAVKVGYEASVSSLEGALQSARNIATRRWKQGSGREMEWIAEIIDGVLSDTTEEE